MRSLWFTEGMKSIFKYLILFVVVFFVKVRSECMFGGLISSDVIIILLGILCIVLVGIIMRYQ